MDDTNIPIATELVGMLKVRSYILMPGICGITKPEMEHMLKGFKVLAKKKPEYVKALIEAYI